MIRKKEIRSIFYLHQTKSDIIIAEHNSSLNDAYL